MNVLGLSAFYHDAACCLLCDGRLIAAASEERFSRIKGEPRLPVRSFRFCLEQGGIGPEEIDCLGYYEMPTAKLSRQLWAEGRAQPDRLPNRPLDPNLAERRIREGLGYDGEIAWFEHHLSHAASAFFFSGFEDAAILTVDGVGEWTTTGYGAGAGARIELFDKVSFPHSLGLFYSTVTSYLGFRVNEGEGKVMGLAPYGRPRFVASLRRLIRSLPGGAFELDLDFFDFVAGRRMYSSRLSDLLGQPPRRPGEELTEFHRDVARSLQSVFEEILLEKSRWLAAQVDSKNLCLAGGGALNCVSNGRLRREGPFEDLFVQPAAGDAGGCLGAAALAHVRTTGEPPGTGKPERLEHVYLGPRWRADEVAEILGASSVGARDYRGREAELLREVADRLARHQIVGWFQGAMEFGPRALGGRSILANPLDPRAQDRLNRVIKRRETFRPFAPSVLEDRVTEHLDLDRPSPFMLETCQVRSPLDLPAVTHVDGSTRPQTVSAKTSPRFAALLEAFEDRTGCPILLNTSMNVASQPMVCSPTDALFCFAESSLDAMVLEDSLIDRADLPAVLPELAALWRARARQREEPRRDVLDGGLYTFV